MMRQPTKLDPTTSLPGLLKSLPQNDYSDKVDRLYLTPGEVRPPLGLAIAQVSNLCPVDFRVFSVPWANLNQ